MTTRVDFFVTRVGSTLKDTQALYRRVASRYDKAANYLAFV